MNSNNTYYTYVYVNICVSMRSIYLCCIYTYIYIHILNQCWELKSKTKNKSEKKEEKHPEKPKIKCNE